MYHQNWVYIQISSKLLAQSWRLSSFEYQVLSEKFSFWNEMVLKRKFIIKRASVETDDSQYASAKWSLFRVDNQNNSK